MYSNINNNKFLSKFYIDPSIYKLIQNLKKNNNINNIKIYSRRSTILPIFIDKTVNIYNGHKFNSIRILPEMIGHKFGEFSNTRIIHVFKKKGKSKK